MMAAMNHVALDYRTTMTTMRLMIATIRNRNDFDVVISERVSTSFFIHKMPNQMRQHKKDKKKNKSRKIAETLINSIGF